MRMTLIDNDKDNDKKTKTQNKDNDKKMTTWMTLVDLSPHVSRLLQTSPHLHSNKLVASQRVQHSEHYMEEESENTDWRNKSILSDYYTAAIFLWAGGMSSLGWW